MASRFFINGGVNNNFSSTSNWSTSSGGAGGASVPGSGDDAIFDANSPNCTVDSSEVVSTLNCSAYASTITFTNPISCAGSITLGASMIFAGTGALKTQSGTFTSNGKAISVPLTLGGFSSTVTLADAMVVTAALTLGLSNTTINGFSITAAGNVTITGGTINGTTTLTLNGTGTCAVASGSVLALTTTINTTGTVTIDGSNPFNYSTGTFTYTAGTVVTTGSTFVSFGACTLNTAGITWANAKFQPASATTTLTSDFALTGTLSLGNIGSNTTVNGHNVIVGSAIAVFAASTVTGTTVLSITGTCTINSGAATNTNGLSLPITINAPGKTVTVTSTFTYSGTLTYTAGTVTGQWSISGGGGGGSTGGAWAFA